MIKTQYLHEIKDPDTNLKKGQKNADVKRVQEWINLWKFYDTNWNLQIEIDGDFGAATEYAVRQFQTYRGLEVDGIAGPKTWKELVRPMREAFDSISFYDEYDLRSRIAAYARQQERSKPTEINSNMGPWVRAYMDGNEGDEWCWCVGFVETILDQAYSSMGNSYKKHFPDPSYFSCDKVLEYAKIHNRLAGKDDLLNGTYVPQTGDMFLLINPVNTTDATHIGIVIECQGNILTTIEGNTDDQIGSRNGGEVCRRTRDFANHLIYVVKQT